MSAQTVQILLVDDNDVDVEGVLRAFTQKRIANPVTVARDGVEALHVLRGIGQPPLPRPFLVLLDLAMPRMNGIEFLDVIRQDAELKDAIVFVLTTSASDQDKVASYNHNVAGYIVKKEVGDGFVRLISLLDHYWRIVEFPPEQDPTRS